MVVGSVLILVDLRGLRPVALAYREHQKEGIIRVPEGMGIHKAYSLRETRARQGATDSCGELNYLYNCLTCIIV